VDSVLQLGYTDDITLGGSQETDAKDVHTVMDVGHNMGLNINVSKSQLIAHPGCYRPNTAVLSTDTFGERRTSGHPSIFWHCAGSHLGQKM